MDNVATALFAHNGKSESSRFQFIGCCAKACQADEDISLFELNNTFIDTGFGIDESSFSVTIVNSEAAHVSIVFLKDMDLLNWLRLNLNCLPFVSFCAHQL